MMLVPVLCQKYHRSTVLHGCHCCWLIVDFGESAIGQNLCGYIGGHGVRVTAESGPATAKSMIVLIIRTVSVAAVSKNRPGRRLPNIVGQPKRTYYYRPARVALGIGHNTPTLASRTPEYPYKSLLPVRSRFRGFLGFTLIGVQTKIVESGVLP